jgi:hypothetical protein
MAIKTATSMSLYAVSTVARVAIGLLGDSKIDVPQNEKNGENPD